MAVVLSEFAEASYVASISARVAGALRRRKENKPAAPGDDYVLRQGANLLESLKQGGRVFFRQNGGYLDRQAVSALPAAISTLAALGSELEKAKVSPKDPQSVRWDKLIRVLLDVLTSKTSDNALVELAVSFFEWLENTLSRDLEHDTEPKRPVLERMD